MNYRIAKGLPWAALAAALLGTAAPAHAADTDFQQWTQFTLQAPLSPRWLGFLEAQPRFGEDAGSLERLIARGAIGYKLSGNVSLWQGYGYIPQFRPTDNYEHRLFQQLQVDDKLGKTSMLNRTRLEERFIKGAGGTSVRLRHMLRLSHPISKDKRWALVGYDEFFFNLNSTDAGPKSGFDQNRLSIGISRQLNKQVRMEVSYIWNYVNARNAPGRDLQILYTGVAVSL